MEALARNFALVLAQLAPFLLLGFVVAGFLHAFVPRSLLIRAMGGKGLGPISRAAFLGIPLPLCSCSVIPVATELRRQGAGRGATIAFMVSTPETGVDSIATSVSVLHPLLVVFRPLAAMVTSVLAGLAVEHLAPLPAGEEEEEGEKIGSCCHHNASEEISGGRRGLLGGLRYAFVDLFGEVGVNLLPAILVTALLSTFISTETMSSWALSPWSQRLLLLLAGIPIYVCATAATPVAAALIVAGFTPGAALTFLLAGPATNLVTISAVKQNLGARSATIYILTVALVSLLFGILLDFLWSEVEFSSPAAYRATHEHLSWVHWVAAVVLGTLMLWHVVGKIRSKAKKTP